MKLYNNLGYIDVIISTFIHMKSHQPSHQTSLCMYLTIKSTEDDLNSYILCEVLKNSEGYSRYHVMAEGIVLLFIKRGYITLVRVFHTYDPHLVRWHLLTDLHLHLLKMKFYILYSFVFCFKKMAIYTYGYYLVLYWNFNE